MKLPLWIAGTCNWGQFDATNQESFAEQLIRLEVNGAMSDINNKRNRFRKYKFSRKYV